MGWRGSESTARRLALVCLGLLVVTIGFWSVGTAMGQDTAEKAESVLKSAAATADGNVVPVGVTAENLTISDPEHVEAIVTDELSISPDVVTVKGGNGTGYVEVRERDVSQAGLERALESAGLEAESGAVRRGVTRATLAEIQGILDERVEQREQLLSHAGYLELQEQVESLDRAGEANYSLSRVPADITGEFAVSAQTPIADDGSPELLPLLTREDIEAVHGPGRVDERPVVSVTLTPEGAAHYEAALRELGFLEEGVEACTDEHNPPDTGYCLRTMVDGHYVERYSLPAGLAERIESGEFAETRELGIETRQRMRVEGVLRTEELPAPLDRVTVQVDDGAGIFEEPDHRGDETDDGTVADDGASSENGTPVHVVERDEYESPPLPEVEDEPAETGPGFTLVGPLLALTLVVLGRCLRSRP